MTKRLFARLLVPVLALTLCACSAETPPEEAADPALAENSTQTPVKPDGALPSIRDPKESDGKIHVLLKNTTGGFWEMAMTGTLNMNKADSIGGTEVVVYAASSSAELEKQIQLAETIEIANPLAVVMDPIDIDILAPVAEKLYEKGIPVITCDSNINSDTYDYFYSTDNYQASYSAAKVFLDQLGGEGKYAVISGTTGASTEMQREKGFYDALAEYPGMVQVGGGTQYTNYDQTKSYSIAYDLLTANPDIKIIFSTFNEIANSTSVALQEMGKAPGEVLNVTFDLDPDARKLCDQKWISGIIQQNPYGMHQKAIQMAYDLAMGNTVRKEPEYIPMDFMLITPENLNTDEVTQYVSPAEVGDASLVNG